MIRFYFIFLMLFLLASCNSKKTSTLATSKTGDTLSHELYKEYPNSIYIGMVTGNIADSFNTENYYNGDSLYQLKPVTQSSKVIEIRFFAENYWSDTGYCILLTYDTSFTISGIKHFYEYDTTIISTTPDLARKSIIEKVQLNCNPDTLFTRLVENGVFSLNNLSDTDYPDLTINWEHDMSNKLKNFPILQLTKKGFIGAGVMGPAMDGVAFRLQYKVDSLFDLVYINNPTAHFRHNPDFPLNRRRYEITNLLLSCINR